MTNDKPALPEATELTLWKKPACPQCTGADLGFKAKGIKPAYKELLAPENADALAAFKANGLMQAPIIQFPAVVDGDEVLFEARAVTGNRVDLIDAYAAAVKTLSARQEELVAA